MREIQFRGKRKDNGEWVEGADVMHKTVRGELCLANIGEDWVSVDPLTFGQYTGLTDKNGSKIFEGDIVNCVYDGDLRTYIVVWDKDELDFKATNGEEQYRNNFQYLSCCDEIEIIGNIYDNPELLENKNLEEHENG